MFVKDQFQFENKDSKHDRGCVHVRLNRGQIYSALREGGSYQPNENSQYTIFQKADDVEQ